MKSDDIDLGYGSGVIGGTLVGHFLDWPGFVVALVLGVFLVGKWALSRD